jgi:hypothetical protein
MDIHKPKPFHDWREFLKEYGIIVLGVLTALGLEQVVENYHDRHLANEARTDIQAELRADLQQLIGNQASMSLQEKQLEANLAVLDSGADGMKAIGSLHYEWDLAKSFDTAWTASRLNGSLALIAPKEIAQASYFHESEDAADPQAYGYFSDMDAAAAIVDHARAIGELTPSMREQLIARTISALGHCRLQIKLLGYERKALEDTDLVKE